MPPQLDIMRISWLLCPYLVGTWNRRRIVRNWQSYRTHSTVVIVAGVRGAHHERLSLVAREVLPCFAASFL